MKQAIKALLSRPPFKGIFAPLMAARARRVFLRWTSADEGWARFYAQMVQPDDLVFDVGANFGYRSKVFCRIAKQVVAVEPQGDCCHTLRDYFREETNFSLEPLAVGSSAGETTMYIARWNVLSTLSEEWMSATVESGRFPQDAWSHSVQVRLVTLDHLIEQHGKPSFIKIDVEGFETEVLKGLSVPVDYLSLEFVREYLETTFECIDLIARLGDYHFRFSRAEEHDFAHEEWLGVDAFKAYLLGLDELAWGDFYARRECERFQ